MLYVLELGYVKKKHNCYYSDNVGGRKRELRLRQTLMNRIVETLIEHYFTTSNKSYLMKLSHLVLMSFCY